MLDCFLSLTRYLVELPAGGQLLKHLFDHILFNPSLWIYSSVDVSNAASVTFSLPVIDCVIRELSLAVCVSMIIMRASKLVM